MYFTMLKGEHKNRKHGDEIDYIDCILSVNTFCYVTQFIY